MFVDVKLTRYSVLMTQDDDWSARMARLVAREVRRYREGQGQRPRMSAQQLADRTEELGMPIPRSVLANLESGRRETVSVAEILVLAGALNVAPIELICPVGYDKEIELLPGPQLDPPGRDAVVRRRAEARPRRGVPGAAPARNGRAEQHLPG